MTGEVPTRYGMESRPSRSNIHLLHPMKTDEIEVLESGAINHHTNIGNGITDHPRTKVSKPLKLLFVKRNSAMRSQFHYIRSMEAFVHSFA